MKKSTHNTLNNKRNLLMNPLREQPNKMHINLFYFMMFAALVFASPEVLAVGDSTDVGLSTGVTNLMTILNNKLTPVVLVAGCLASLVYSFSIAQPKPFILSLVTLCGFGFARAWINGTYALIG